MQLNIKNADVRSMADRLAARTGKSVTQAIADALRHELEALDRERDIERRVAELDRITASIQADLRDGYMTHEEFDAWLYDENGLPH